MHNIYETVCISLCKMCSHPPDAPPDQPTDPAQTGSSAPDSGMTATAASCPVSPEMPPGKHKPTPFHKERRRPEPIRLCS